MRSRFLLIFVIILCPSPAAAGPPSPEVSQLIDRVLDAYGGWEALTNVAGYRMRGTILTGHSKPPAPTSRILVRPDRLKVVLGYPDGAEVRIIDGDQGWRTGLGGELAEAQGPMLDSMVLQLARATLPWILAERRSTAKLAEPVGLAGLELELEGLEVPLGEGLSLRAYLDPDTLLVNSALTVLESPMMQIHFETRYSEFRTVEGVRFAFREENFAGGNHTASTRIESIELNPEIPDEAFRP